jgi:hypothetical protein
MSHIRPIFRVFIIIGFLCASSLSAQSLPPALKKAREERSAATRCGDAKVYGRCTLDDFVAVMPDGSIQTKSDRMSAMERPLRSYN